MSSHCDIILATPSRSYWCICTIGLQGKEAKEGVGMNGTGLKDTIVHIFTKKAVVIIQHSRLHVVRSFELSSDEPNLTPRVKTVNTCK